MKESIERTEQIEELNNIGDSLDYFVKKEEKHVAANGTTQQTVESREKLAKNEAKLETL